MRRRTAGGPTKLKKSIDHQLSVALLVVERTFSHEGKRYLMVKFFASKKVADESMTSSSPLLGDEQFTWLKNNEDTMPSSSSSSRSPLMATDDSSVTGLSRQQTLTSSSTSGTASVSSLRSKSSKKSNKTELSREERDGRDVKLGCCHIFGGLLIKAIHVIDALLGILLLTYGSLIITKFAKPAMTIAVICLTLGSVLLLAAIMGFIGFHYKVCKRVGLALSAYMAPFIAFFYLIIVIAVLAVTDKFFNYLRLHKDVLYLSATQIKSLRDLLPLFYIVLLVLAVLEMSR